ncbi:hypothetical protein LMG28688_04509 [Paraburkholderia caffeinitolerans]|uniref:Oxidoreductase molybdopterin-binding domain-containing protein n=1 Tax=Paraburkholderia caffeinitolerans TaxID=1723730 RepID=A0A6J5GI33_9BURK|nr:molybdopterin-dependent oxidoreductase [Paraburkholderia caffeinitolerans]CAB3797361.1 hypothetical protein LMG28688_04509 [Paraburkholderia caffeinitolerans]
MQEPVAGQDSWQELWQQRRQERKQEGRPASRERRRFTAALAGWLAVAAAPVPRLALAARDGSLQLDVNGEVRTTNNAAHTAYHFSADALLKLPPHSIVTSTTWTPRATFTGPLLSDVLGAVGAYGSEIEIHTIDDYTCVVPVSDAARFGAVLAYEMNGQRLKVSNFGPLFLVYPRDQYPQELDGAAGDAKFAWQIVSMTIKQ